MSRRWYKPVKKDKKPLKQEIAAVFAAMQKGDFAPVHGYLSKGGNPNLKDEWGQPLLLSAIKTGDVPLVKTLLKRGANPSFEGRDVAPLTMAARIDNVAVAKLLIQHGADPKKGALFAVALNDSPNVAKLLIRSGANPNQLFNGQRPLHVCAEMGSLNSIKVLLANKADVNGRDKNGNTLLHTMAEVFIRNMHQPVLELALQQGADLSLTNKAGKTAVGLAQDEDAKEFFQSLAKHR